MAISRNKKEEIVKNLKDRIAKSKSLVFARFHGLGVDKAQTLRKGFRDGDAEYMVAKKTLINIALKESGREIPEKLDGEVALATGYGDELLVFKTASDFAKKEKEAFEILGGFFEGEYVDAGKAKQLGAIPGRDGLYGQLVGVLAGNIRKFMYTVNEISNKKGQA
ncbi:MAG: 50S ribosomal protein L10 [bacterium]|nr:50S ribosomal protein L10 [bacterium]